MYCDFSETITFYVLQSEPSFFPCVFYANCQDSYLSTRTQTNIGVGRTREVMTRSSPLLLLYVALVVDGETRQRAVLLGRARGPDWCPLSRCVSFACTYVYEPCN